MLTDFVQGVAFELEGENLRSGRFQSGDELFDEVGKEDRFLRPRLLGESGVEVGVGRLRWKGKLPANIATGGVFAFASSAALVMGDGGEDAPEMVPVFEVELSVLTAAEEAAEDGLHDVLGIEAGLERTGEALSGEVKELIGEAMIDASTGVVVAGLNARDQTVERIGRVHDAAQKDAGSNIATPRIIEGARWRCKKIWENLPRRWALFGWVLHLNKGMKTSPDKCALVCFLVCTPKIVIL